jgi:hypothetical protein
LLSQLSLSLSLSLFPFISAHFIDFVGERVDKSCVTFGVNGVRFQIIEYRHLADDDEDDDEDDPVVDTSALDQQEEIAAAAENETTSDHYGQSGNDKETSENQQDDDAEEESNEIRDDDDEPAHVKSSRQSYKSTISLFFDNIKFTAKRIDLFKESVIQPVLDDIQRISFAGIEMLATYLQQFASRFERPSSTQYNLESATPDDWQRRFKAPKTAIQNTLPKTNAII